MDSSLPSIFRTMVIILAFQGIQLETFISSTKNQPCIPRDYGQGSVVCVCNATYWDIVEPNIPLPQGKYSRYTSSKSGQRLHKEVLQFGSAINNTEGILIQINRQKTYQSILGFGGAFTDAAGINIASLSPAAADNVLKSYFSPDGIEYTVGRVPMASCDFSTHLYTYDDNRDDFDLKEFSLKKEDHLYKIPYIQRARQLQRPGRPLVMFASPWTAPAWMKTNQNETGKGTLIGRPGTKYYQTWAQYFIKFLQEYQQHNITFWGVTTQNEPTTGMLANFSYQALGFTPELQRDFVALDLGPALEKSGFEKIKIMIMDDQRLLLPEWATVVLSTPAAAKYVSGIAVHWYLDRFVPPLPLSLTHKAFPDKFIFATEACAGSQFSERKVILGSWERFEQYSKDIMEDLANWVVGWTDWNMALDPIGGPNWVNNFVDSPIIVNKTADEFYKQPMFYAMGHFSKFLNPESVRLDIKLKGVNALVQVLAFSQLDKSTVVIISNRDAVPHPYHVVDLNTTINGEVGARSMQTLTWWQ